MEAEYLERGLGSGDEGWLLIDIAFWYDNCANAELCTGFRQGHTLGAGVAIKVRADKAVPV